MSLAVNFSSSAGCGPAHSASTSVRRPLELELDGGDSDGKSKNTCQRHLERRCTVLAERHEQIESECHRRVHCRDVVVESDAAFGNKVGCPLADPTVNTFPPVIEHG